MSPRRGVLVLVVVVSLTAAAQDAGVPVIPRELLLGNPERTSPRLSPDGKRLAWIAPDEQNVLQVWVQTLGQKDDAVVTQDKKRGVRGYQWTRDSRGLLYGQDADGDENFHVFLVDLPTKNVRDLTPWQGVRASVIATHPRFPDLALVEMNVRDRKVMDVWRVNLKTGAAELDTENPGDVDGWVVDSSFVVRGATAALKGGGVELRVRDSAKAKWTPLVTVGLEERVSFAGFTDDGRGAFITTSVNGDTDRLVEKSLKSGAERVLAQSATSDVMSLLGHPTKHVLRAAAFDVGGRAAWTPIDGSVQGDLAGLDQALDGDFEVVSMDDADARWLVAEHRDAGPTRFWTWDRKAKKAELLFSAQPRLDGLLLSAMTPVSIPARDGLVLHGYLTLPPSKAKPLPMVLLVHGGPWGRDGWGYDGLVQLLANRGYAVLQVNFRGSTGYGKRFLNAGNRQWGLAMHDDLIDAVGWAVREGVTTPRQVAIMGASYGGYATLAGLAFTPDTFACGVDVVGPSNLFTLLQTIPPYWSALKAMLIARIGDPDDPKDKELLTKASPLFSAEKIKAPLLIGQGANDPRVKVAESEQIVSAMEKKGLPVTYVLYPDEGHGFARAENRLDFMARAEAFLAKCLGGRAEPLPKEGRVRGATAVVKAVGAKQ
ncbi:MAG: S9 family peptidase [Myxococcota bacterium]|jgi:dipeptidyl aminopeptidase/acylaminoacyl peptidase